MSCTASPPSFVDVHCHLIHGQFPGEEADKAAQRAADQGLEYCIVNGLCPESNREVIELCSRHENLKPAVGIYPIEACNGVLRAESLPEGFRPPPSFNVDDEVDWIAERAASGEIIAIGECGMDAHYLTEDVHLAEQERVLRRLIEVAKKYDKPLILHTRKVEQRVFDLLVEEGVRRADFHCFCGKVKLAKKIAEAGYYLSIPSGVERMENFQQLARALQLESILTETDSPYMGPDKGGRNEPATVPRGVAAIAAARGEEPREVALQIRRNFETLFRL